MRFPALFLIVIALFSSCLKKSDKSNSPYTALAIINATPYADSAYVYMDGGLLDSGALPFTKKLGYYRVTNLNHEILVVKDSHIIGSGFGAFEEGKYFSLFITRTADTTILVATDDDVTKPKNGKGKIRFVNLNYDAPGISAAIENGPVVATNVVFKAASPFVEVNPGIYNLDFRDATSPETSKYLMRGIRVESGKIYTIWSYGLWSSINPADKFNININENI